MNQQINLYLAEFKVKKDILTVLLMGQILAGVVLILGLVSASNLFEQWQLNSEVADLGASLIEETRNTEELDDQLALRAQSTDLVERLEQAEARLDSRRQISSFLSESTLGNVVGFSEYFKDLSRATMPGLSISEFSFSNGGEEITVAGQVIEPAMAPRYVSNLQRSNSLIRGKHFNPSISRPNITDPYFTFRLNTTNE